MAVSKKHAEVIKAWLNGAEIEVKHKDKEKWHGTNDPYFYGNLDYRVKPKEKAKKLVPFTFEDAKELIGKPVISLSAPKPFVRDSLSFITVVLSTDVKPVYVGNSWFSFYELAHGFNFLDGSPCGKYIEE